MALHESADPIASVAFGVACGFVQFDYAQCVRCEEVGQHLVRRGHLEALAEADKFFTFCPDAPVRVQQVVMLVMPTCRAAVHAATPNAALTRPPIQRAASTDTAFPICFFTWSAFPQNW